MCLSTSLPTTTPPSTPPRTSTPPLSTEAASTSTPPPCTRGPVPSIPSSPVQVVMKFDPHDDRPGRELSLPEEEPPSDTDDLQNEDASASPSPLRATDTVEPTDTVEATDTVETMETTDTVEASPDDVTEREIFGTPPVSLLKRKLSTEEDEATTTPPASGSTPSPCVPSTTTAKMEVKGETLLDAVMPEDDGQLRHRPRDMMTKDVCLFPVVDDFQLKLQEVEGQLTHAREEITLLTSKLESQKDMLDSVEEQRRTAIAAKDQEIESLKAELESVSKSKDASVMELQTELGNYRCSHAAQSDEIARLKVTVKEIENVVSARDQVLEKANRELREKDAKLSELKLKLQVTMLKKAAEKQTEQKDRQWAADQKRSLGGNRTPDLLLTGRTPDLFQTGVVDDCNYIRKCFFPPRPIPSNSTTDAPHATVQPRVLASEGGTASPTRVRLPVRVSRSQATLSSEVRPDSH
ncbi:unnamed protein product [Cyprideis torosa]|uniref:Uncharacterized protein n=1 Tax=Cyprideis torosa TaxID=163714 RepID=A0A7R8WG94_9CRUS|nr:unnamed protein product [Cyprideis torosa]CAG0897817.1 unnamed protein product [Cyprideis torosa]